MKRQTELLQFQESAYKQHLKFLEILGYTGILWDMGTGKTINIFYLYEEMFQRDMVRHLIVICPKTLMQSPWADQLKEHLDSDDYLKWENKDTDKFINQLRDFINHPGRIFIVNIEAFSYKNERLFQFVENLCKNYPVYMVCDESSWIKSPVTADRRNKKGEFHRGKGAARTKNLLKFSAMAKYRSIATGTEIVKNVLDLWSQYEFLKADFWGRSFYGYQAKYAIMTNQWCAGGVLRRNVKYVGSKDIKELQEKIMSCSVRVLKKDALPFLPEKRYQTIRLEMPDELRTIYDTMKRDMVAEYQGKELTVANKAVLFGRFRQLCGGFFPSASSLTQAGAKIKENAKLEVLLAELSDTDDQAIVWTCFTDEIKMLASELEAEMIYGEIQQYRRDEILERFKAGEFKTLVLNPGVGAFGLNLQFVSLVYYYSNPLRADHRWQSEDRCHRVGMLNPVLYKDLIYMDSIDERVQKLLAEKTKLREEFQKVNPKQFEYVEKLPMLNLDEENSQYFLDIMNFNKMPKEQFFDLF